MERLACDNRPPFNGERFLTRQGAFRNIEDQPQVPAGQEQGQLPYIQLVGKILYRQSDIEKLLEGGNYHPCIGIISYSSF